MGLRILHVRIVAKDRCFDAILDKLPAGPYYVDVMSGWDAIVLESLEQVTPMWARIDALFAHARDTWDFFRLAEATLTSIRTKVLTHEGARIIVQANPGRKRSIHARVDPKTIADRPCFLCLENLPAAERGLGCGNLVILPNPYPIVGKFREVA
jgi:hypothetical protein